LSPAAIHNPFFRVGFIVPDLEAAMDEFQTALGIEWRAPIDAIFPLRGPGTPLAGTGGVSFHHLGFWTDQLASSSRDLVS
jgi:hypothetical protein